MTISKRCSAGYVGNDIYNVTGVRQTKRAQVRRQQKMVYYLRIQNDDTTADRFVIRGPRGNAKWRVQYFTGCRKGVRITSQVTGAGWQTSRLGFHQSRRFRVEVTPRAGATIGSKKVLRIEARAAYDPAYTSMVDAVRAITTVATGTTISQLTTFTVIPTAAGAQVVFSLSGSAAVTVEILNIAGRVIRRLWNYRLCEAGRHVLIWNGRSDQGVTAPAGLYLVKVAARGDDGVQTCGVESSAHYIFQHRAIAWVVWVRSTAAASTAQCST